MLHIARKFDVAGRDERNRALGRAGEDPAHQQLHDPGLLCREQLAPDVIERLQRGDHVSLGEGVTLARQVGNHKRRLRSVRGRQEYLGSRCPSCA